MSRSLLILTASSLLVLASCGGGGGDGGSVTMPIANIEVGADDTSAPADTIDTLVLQQKAASNASRAIGVNVAGVRNVSEDTNSLVVAATTEDGMLNDDIGLENDELIPTAAIETVDSDADRLLVATLGLDASGRASATRVGNRITIDPDEQAVCEGEVFLGDDDLQQCLQLVQDLTVQLDAATEESGRITYIFQNSPLLSIVYGPSAASYELNLATYFLVESAAAQLISEPLDVASMSGSVRLIMNVENAAIGTESGSVTLAIPEAVSITADDGSSFSLAASNVLTLSADADTGNASIEFGMGALNFLQAASSESTASSLTMSGLTGRFAFNESSDGLSVSNLGFGGAPISLNTDGLNFDLSLSAFGFDLSSDGELSMTQALNLALTLIGDNSDEGQMSITANLSAPAGTRLADGATTADIVQSGGPLSLNYAVSGGGQSANGLISLAPGSCQNSAENDPNNPFADLISCQ